MPQPAPWRRGRSNEDTSMHAGGLQPDADSGHLLQDRSWLVLRRTLPECDAGAAATVRASAQHRWMPDSPLTEAVNMSNYLLWFFLACAGLIGILLGLSAERTQTIPLWGKESLP